MECENINDVLLKLEISSAHYQYWQFDAILLCGNIFNNTMIAQLIFVKENNNTNNDKI